MFRGAWKVCDMCGYNSFAFGIFRTGCESEIRKGSRGVVRDLGSEA